MATGPVSPTTYLLAALPPLFWSGNFLFARVMHDVIPPIQMSFWRWVVAFLILLPFAMPHFKREAVGLRREWPFLALLGLVGITAFNCFLYSALHYTTVVSASLINSMLPVVTFLFALVLLGEHLSPRQVLGVVVSLAGALVIIGRGDVLQIAAIQLHRGDLLVIAGMTFWALYTVLIKWRPTALPLIPFLTATIGFGLLFHVPFLAWEIPAMGGFAVTWASAGAIVYFAVFPSVLAYLFWNKAVTALGPGRTGMFIHLLPIFSTVLGVAFLDESFLAYHAVGIALIFAGIFLVTRPVARS